MAKAPRPKQNAKGRKTKGVAQPKVTGVSKPPKNL
jgi:hypothetical protein